MIDLTIITVTYQSKDYIDGCILSVVTSTLDCKYEHLVVDNHSTDGTVELLEREYSHLIRLIKNPQNMGFSAANNQALKEARGRFILFLNPDMQIHAGFLDSLITWMDANQEIGLASCRLLNAFKEPHPSLRPHRFPRLSPYFFAFLGLTPFFCSVNPLFWYPSFQDEKEQEVEVVRGAFMFVRKEILDRLGFGFDPRYYILLEDIDLCREVSRLGYKIFYTPQVTCVDHFGRSFAQQTQPWKYLQLVKSLYVYVRKWHSLWYFSWLPLISWIGFIVRIPRWGIRASLAPFLRKSL